MSAPGGCVCSGGVSATGGVSAPGGPGGPSPTYHRRCAMCHRKEIKNRKCHSISMVSPRVGCRLLRSTTQVLQLLIFPIPLSFLWHTLHIYLFDIAGHGLGFRFWYRCPSPKLSKVTIGIQVLVCAMGTGSVQYNVAIGLGVRIRTGIRV